MDVGNTASRASTEAKSQTFARFPAACPSRVVLSHVTSRWGVLVLLALEPGSMRWGELRRTIEGISEKMLASTLRTLEQDGIVHRAAQASIPPRVDYSLTETGTELAARLLPLMDWILDNADAIVARPAVTTPATDPGSRTHQ
ncbi:winged helix-turn-helix transcriptional regulator [Frondihabitans sp. Leaf304]|uniref:winged helix-turn-helix transcriptional regulator n=1 Tax=Frondihabitans sp. Leaf304 TaxID=1736329 RepID=UPI0006F6194E|nr:helix-turn-helix domain-containing protein [Frondihabitans sp. Leaf304]KQQ28599.1 transcriptional regulator [Frondihabitans sp. Leaf304]